jgi:hypothetical protein
MNEINLESFINSRLDENADLDIIIIKGHLLIEGYLDNILTASYVTRSKLGKLSLSFNQKLLIANSLCKKSSEDAVWEYIKEINNIRNNIAHNFWSPKRETLVDKALLTHLSLLDEQLSEKTKKLTVEGQIRSSFFIVIGFLDAFLNDLNTSFTNNSLS